MYSIRSNTKLSSVPVPTAIHTRATGGLSTTPVCALKNYFQASAFWKCNLYMYTQCNLYLGKYGILIKPLEYIVTKQDRLIKTWEGVLDLTAKENSQMTPEIAIIVCDTNNSHKTIQTLHNFIQCCKNLGNFWSMCRQWSPGSLSSPPKKESLRTRLLSTVKVCYFG